LRNPENIPQNKSEGDVMLRKKERAAPPTGMQKGDYL
jgi:hypothetical protein